MQQGVTIRPFVGQDLPQALELLEASLGGGPVGRRAPEFFRWKHLESPFGPSFMLVAEQEARLVGLRAFMRWRFVAGGRPVRAARAVDTATHPDYRGAGIFTRLTRSMLEVVHGDVDLIFNTPNAKSGPGYLKMGWVDVGRVPVMVRARRPLRLLAQRRPSAPLGDPPTVQAASVAAVLARGDEVTALLAAEPTVSALATPRDLQYLRWRYAAAPELGYRAVTEERAGELAGVALFRVRPRGRLWESTVAEVLASGDRRTARRLLRRVAAAAPVDHLTLHAPRGSVVARAAAASGFLPSPGGIRLVANPRVPDLRPDPRDLGAWALSLGDLEVF
jgi:GNAT superfamily N-acetyltransferase